MGLEADAGSNTSSEKIMMKQHTLLITDPLVLLVSQQLSHNVQNQYDPICVHGTFLYAPWGALGYFLGGYVLPGTPNCHPILKKFPQKLIPCSRNGQIFYTPFQKWAYFLYPVLEFALKLIPRSRNGPIFYNPFQKVCKLKQTCFFKEMFLSLFDLYIK